MTPPKNLPFIGNQQCSKSSHWDGDHNQNHNKQRINHFLNHSRDLGQIKASLNGIGLPAEWLVLHLSENCAAVTFLCTRGLRKPHTNNLNIHRTTNRKYGTLI